MGSRVGTEPHGTPPIASNAALWHANTVCIV